VVGEETALVIHDYEQPVRVFGYDELIGQATNFKTVSAVIAYVHPETGTPETYSNRILYRRAKKGNRKVAGA
jgi:hypothetical protein